MLQATTLFHSEMLSDVGIMGDSTFSLSDSSSNIIENFPRLSSDSSSIPFTQSTATDNATELDSIQNNTKLDDGSNKILILTISLHGLIFFICLAGNGLVIITVVQNKRMRSITNLLLTNLATCDIMIGIFSVHFP